MPGLGPLCRREPESGIIQPRRETAARALGNPVRADERQARIEKVSARVYDGKQVETRTKLTKTETGAIGEAIVKHYFESLGLTGRVRAANDERSNYPVDLLAGDNLVEIKTGLVSNNPKSHRWAATIGEPGAAEKAALAAMTDEQKRAWNAGKEAKIMARKSDALRELSTREGVTLRPVTVTMIMNPDTQTVDLYRFEGYHQRIGWRGEEAKHGYVGTYRYGKA